MNKEIIIKILEQKPLSEIELNTFISDYIFQTKHIHISVNELLIIVHLIEMNAFDLRYAALNAANLLNLQITELYINNILIKTYVK